ncbi:expressed unknown protein [Ectocarpus siliculosus]|uniref:Uncharacterized protein n=1 Tax=Ectocarpus siliculosus TaxID=2880 RepID=D7FZU8_ECTSI|nr:expressed unknown protein [Ectocarpus siliculosus]|eukprot:CBJ32905.1 expressed unknown protein [Ectocarpus siliculosus]
MGRQLNQSHHANVHAVEIHCVLAKTSGGKLLKNATPTTKKRIGKSCVRADENNIADDLQTGCTGIISEGDLVIKDWDPPLHFYCARRLWKESVTQTLKAKKIIKEIGTTEEEEDYFVNVFCVHASTRENLAQALDSSNFACVTNMALELVYSWL